MRQGEENTAEPRRPQRTIWRMRFAYWIPKATKTHLVHVLIIACAQQQSLKESAQVLRYIYLACLVYSKQRCIVNGIIQ